MPLKLVKYLIYIIIIISCLGIYLFLEKFKNKPTPRYHFDYSIYKNKEYKDEINFSVKGKSYLFSKQKANVE